MEFALINPIDPASGPRKTWLKTRIVKNEFELTSKRAVSQFDPDASLRIPVSRAESRSIVTFPLATIILSRVPVCAFGLSPDDCGAGFPELLFKSKSSGSAK